MAHFGVISCLPFADSVLDDESDLIKWSFKKLLYNMTNALTVLPNILYSHTILLKIVISFIIL